MATITQAVVQTLVFTQNKPKVKRKVVGSRPKKFGNRSNQFHPFNLKQ